MKITIKTLQQKVFQVRYLACVTSRNSRRANKHFPMRSNRSTPKALRRLGT